MIEVPEFDSAQVVEMHGVRDWVLRGLRRRNSLRRFGHHVIPFAKFHFQRERLMRRLHMLKETVDVQTWMFAEHGFGLRKNIFDKSRWNNS